MLIDKISILLLSLLLVACAGPGNGEVSNVVNIPRSVIAAVDCGSSAQQPSLKLLDTQVGMAEVMSHIATVVGDDSIGQYSISAKDEILVQINMGRQSTGGYALKLKENEFIVKDGWAIIKVQWIVPTKGMMLTQALTSPCLLVAIPKQDYAGVRVIDQTGVVRLQSDL